MGAVTQVDARELASRLGGPDEPFLVDVREPAEVAEWSIPGAVNIPLGQLTGRTGELPRDRTVVTLCASGARSMAAAEWLTAQGYGVANLTGGMAAWATVYDTASVAAGDTEVVQIRRRAKGCLSYMVGAGDAAFVIDPSSDLEVYEGVAAQHGWQITRVFDTHLHADHLSGARALAQRTGATLHLNPADHFGFPFTPLTDREAFPLPSGTAMEVSVLHTPGHTEGSTIYRIGDAVVLTGDTLFVDGVGRPDLAERAEPFARQLHRSLQERVLSLPDEARILPAHHGSDVRVVPGETVGAPLGRLRQELTALRMDEEAFVRWAVARVTARPPHYQEIVRANLAADPDTLAALRPLEAGPNRCAA